MKSILFTMLLLITAYKIKAGETLSHLATKYGISVKKILRLNKGLKDTSILQIGQKIRVR